MRLLVLSSDRFPPFRVDVNVLFAQELAAQGVDIDWILQSDTPRRHSEAVAYGSGTAWVGANVEGDSALAKAARIIQGTWHDLAVFSRARATRYDAIQVKDKFIAALFGLIAAKITRTKFVYWLSYPFPEAQTYTAIHGLARFPIVNRIRGMIYDVLLYKMILPYADFAFVQSEQMKKDIVARGIEAEKMTPVPMGITQALLDTELDVHLAPVPTVAYLGTMIPVRRLDFVIRVFAKVLEQVPNAKLLMIGGPESDLAPLRQEAQRLEIAANVDFTGNLPQLEALQTVASAHVCLSPFYPTPILNSTSPTKLVEYMALGKAVVANHHPEQTKVLKDSEAGLCVTYDEAAFADAIVQIIRNPTLMHEMGRKGRAYAEARSYSNIAKLVLQTYQRVLQPGEAAIS